MVREVNLSESVRGSLDEGGVTREFGDRVKGVDKDDKIHGERHSHSARLSPH